MPNGLQKLNNDAKIPSKSDMSAKQRKPNPSTKKPKVADEDAYKLKLEAKKRKLHENYYKAETGYGMTPILRRLCSAFGIGMRGCKRIESSQCLGNGTDEKFLLERRLICTIHGTSYWTTSSFANSAEAGGFVSVENMFPLHNMMTGDSAPEGLPFMASRSCWCS
ncbi:hypothetical protein Droror1_Dr00027538 [Drosera rotundifolia]